MDTQSTIKIQDGHVHVDPQHLFQMLVTVGMRNGKLQHVFDRELSHYPPALFVNIYLHVTLISI